eukprot:Gb_16340 [translate_table: standard]
MLSFTMDTLRTDTLLFLALGSRGFLFALEGSRHVVQRFSSCPVPPSGLSSGGLSFAPPIQGVGVADSTETRGEKLRNSAAFACYTILHILWSIGLWKVLELLMNASVVSELCMFVFNTKCYHSCPRNIKPTTLTNIHTQSITILTQISKPSEGFTCITVNSNKGITQSDLGLYLLETIIVGETSFLAVDKGSSQACPSFPCPVVMPLRLGGVKRGEWNLGPMTSVTCNVVTSVSMANGIDNTYRRKWNREEYIERARERDEEEEDGRFKSKAKALPVQRKPLKHRDYEVDLDSRLGKTQFPPLD